MAEDEVPTVIPAAGQAARDDVTSPDAAHSTLPGEAARRQREERQLPKRGDRIDHFVVQRRLGSGAMGVVLLAVDEELDRQVAIKLLTAALQGPVAQARLVREARSGARLQHPNVVAVHQVGTHEGQVYLVMEYVDGGTLREWLEDEHPWDEIVDVFAQAGRGLAAAHEAGMVHRDFKPDNVLIDKRGRARVSDFGLVDAGGDVSESDSTQQGWGTGERLTQTGAVMGTPMYMSPEQIRGALIDARSDQFAFCIALYEALWRTPPFEATNLAVLLQSRIDGAADPPRGRVPSRVRDAVMRGLSHEPSARFGDMPALLRELQRRGSTTTTAVIVGLGVVGATAAVLVRNDARAVACPDSAVELERVWGADQRAAVRAAFDGSGYRNAAASFDRLDAELRSFGERWDQALGAVCDGAEQAGSQRFAAQRGCLFAARDETASLSQLLLEASPPLIDGSFVVARSAPDPDRCVDAVAAPAPVGSEQAELRRDTLRLELHNAAARWMFAREGPGEAVEARARTLGDPRLLARVLLARGRAGIQSNHPAADAQLRETMALAANASDHAREAEATALLLRITTTLRRHESEAIPLLPAAEAAAQRAGDPRSAAVVATNAGSTLMVQGDVAGAIAKWTEAIDTLRAWPRAPPDELGDAYRFRGMLRAHEEGYEAGSADLARAEAAFVEGLGPGHPLTGEQLRLIGDVQMFLGKLPEALRLFERAVTILDASVGPGSRAAISAVTQAGRVHLSEADNGAARGRFEDAWTRCSASGGCDDLLQSTVLESLAWTERAGQRYPDAVRHYRAAVAIVQRIGDAAYQARVLAALGQTLGESGDHAAAQVEFAKMRDLAVAEHGPKHRTVVAAGIQLGHSARYASDCERARQEYRRALRVLNDLETPPGYQLAAIMLGLGECELSAGDLEAARESLRTAHGLLSAEFESEIHAQIEFMWARMLEVDGQHAEALVQARAARVRLAALMPMQRAWLDRVDAWLAERGEAQRQDTP